MLLANASITVFDAVASSVDDQIEWINNDTLVYEVTDVPLMGRPQTNLMLLDIKAPVPKQRLWLTDARSPGFVR